MIHHPATYLNKVLVASSQGSMQLWNIRTQYANPHAPSAIHEYSIALQNIDPHIPCRFPPDLPLKYDLDRYHRTRPLTSH